MEHAPHTAREAFVHAIAEAAGILFDVMAPASAPRAEILKPKEVAAELRTSLSQVSQLCRDGKLKATRVGKLWRIHRTDLERFKNRR